MNGAGDNSAGRGGEASDDLSQRLAELERTNAALRRENTLLRHAVASAPAQLFTVTPDYRVQWLGGHRSDAAGQSLDDLAGPAEAETLKQAVQRVLNGDEPQVCSVRSPATGKNLQARFARLEHADDAPPQVVCVALDVTREQAERNQLRAQREEIKAALAESDQRFRIVVENTPVPVAISDVETSQIMHANQALAEFLETSHESLTRLHTKDLYVDTAQRQALVDQVVRGEKIRGQVAELKSLSGKRIWAALYLDLINYGGRQALLTCLLDISARKQREEEILRDRRALRRLLDANEGDRRLIAYEIHDGVVQDMTGALMFLQSATSLLPPDVEGAEEVQRASQSLSHGIREIRRLLNGLRPLSLEQGGVVAAIEDLITKAATDHGLAVKFAHNVSFDRIAPSLEMAIYRTVQESLTNAQRHSGSPTAYVAIEQSDSTILISVRDEGSGFDPGQVPQSRCGLSGIRERATLLGGQAEIISQPGQGTHIKVTLPIGDYLEGPGETNL